VKGLHKNFLENDINADIILGNTYHLYLRPGLEINGKSRWYSWLFKLESFLF